MDTINLMPTWESLWKMCRYGEFPKVYEELLKPCKLADTINEELEKGKSVKITKGKNGEILLETEE